MSNSLRPHGLQHARLPCPSPSLLKFMSIELVMPSNHLMLYRSLLRLQCRKPGFDPWVGKIPCRRKWQPTPVFLPGESCGQRSLVSYSPWGCKESGITERLNSFTSLLLGNSNLYHLYKSGTSVLVESHLTHQIHPFSFLLTWTGESGRMK